MTLPSSATVVPAMSRQAVVICWLIGPSPSRRAYAACGPGRTGRTSPARTGRTSPARTGDPGGPRSREGLLGDGGRAGHAPPAGAGHEDHARRDLRAVVELGRRHLAVDAGPPATGRRQRGPEQLLGPAAEVIIVGLVPLECERLG